MNINRYYKKTIEETDNNIIFVKICSTRQLVLRLLFSDGVEFIDIRTWFRYKNSLDNAWIPTKKGLFMPLQECRDIFLPALDKYINNDTLIEIKK